MIKLRATITFEYEVDDDWYPEGLSIDEIAERNELDLADLGTALMLLGKWGHDGFDPGVIPIRWPAHRNPKKEN